MVQNVNITAKFIFWTPRIFIILLALFLAIFSFDIFGNNYTFWEMAVGLFMHNIPSLVLLGILLLSWKNDLAGGIIFMILGITCVIATIIMLLSGGIMNPIFIIGSVVFILTSVLFILGWKQTRHKNIKVK